MEISTENIVYIMGAVVNFGFTTVLWFFIKERLKQIESNRENIAKIYTNIATTNGNISTIEANLQRHEANVQRQFESFEKMLSEITIYTHKAKHALEERDTQLKLVNSELIAQLRELKNSARK